MSCSLRVYYIEVENQSKLPDCEIENEPSTGKRTRFELPKIPYYDEIDRFQLSIDDPEDLITARICSAPV
jgi:hypothetical protein